MGLLMQGGAAVNSQGKICTNADYDLMKQNRHCFNIIH